METLWLGLAFLLAASSLGASGLLSLAFAGVAFVLGSLVLLTGVSLATSNVVLLTLLRQSRQSWSWFKGALISNDKVRINDAEVYDLRLKWEATSLTGSEHIDEPLNLILGYVLRDYIYPWHFKVTHDRAFPMHLKDTINHVIIHMSSKIKSVDWIPFLTTRLVDDVASHVRLFKKARLSLKIRSKADQQTDGKIVDLESLFFDAEVAMETTLCRDLAASIQQEELNYLQSVAEILLFLLLKEDDFNAIPMRTLGREIIVNVLLKPTLDLLSDPDFINQTLVWLYEDYKIKHDVFLTSIRYSENMEELLATRETLNKEISFIRSNDSKGELDSTLKQQLNSLLYLKKVIDARIHRIQSGSDTDSMGIPAHVDWNQMIGPGLRLFDLPIDVILKNNIALSYFIDYMTSIGCQSYLFFYLTIEGWKVSAETQIQGNCF
jgi:sorting nexin-13